MSTSSIDIEQRSTKATTTADPAQISSLEAHAAARPGKSAGHGWVQGAAEKLNRMRTDEAYRQEIAAKAR